MKLKCIADFESFLKYKFFVTKVTNFGKIVVKLHFLYHFAPGAPLERPVHILQHILTQTFKQLGLFRPLLYGIIRVSIK